MRLCISPRAFRIIFLLSAGINLVFTSAQACIFENKELNCSNFTYNDHLLSEIDASEFEFEKATFVGSRILIIPQFMFIGFEHVKMMELSKSKIYFIEPGAFDSMAMIEWLRLHANRLTDIEQGTFNSLTTLQRLDLSYNRLATIKQHYFSKLNSLEEVWLNNNMIKHLEPYAFHGLFKLTSLYLYDNYLDALRPDCFMDLAYLTTLYLSGNSLMDMDNDIFNGLTQLNKLCINDNNLSTIRMAWFHSLTALRRLEINNNALTEFNGQELLSSLPRLSEIKLNDNLWSCNSLGENLKILSGKNVWIIDNSTENGVFGITCQNSTIAEIRGVEVASSKTVVVLIIIIVVLLVLVVALVWLLITVYGKVKRSTALSYRSANLDDAEEGPYNYVGPPR